MVDHTNGSAVRRDRRRRVRRWTTAAVLTALSALAVAAPASAVLFKSTASATRASIGQGSYLITLTNTGPTSIASFTIVTEATTVMPGSCKSLGGAIVCAGDLAPGASAQVCYSGTAARAVLLGLTQPIKLTSAPRTTCPLPGFKPTVVTVDAGSTPTAVHPWKNSRCIAEYKAWKKKHKRATARQKQAQRGKLHRLHRCPLRILK